jgi:geranylgeranyl pyrophosphate synthase
MNRTRALERSLEQADSLAADARSALAILPDSEERNALDALVDYALERSL